MPQNFSVIAAVTKLMFHWILRSYFREASRKHAGFHDESPMGLLDFKWNFYDSTDYSKYHKYPNS
jgi:hypothetical protein